jgi:superfamily II RNA helicase
MSTSNQLKGVYRITSEQDGETYTIDFQPAGRRRMNGTITGTTASVFVHIQPKERPDGLRVEIAGTVLFGRWLDTQHRLLEVISASKTPYAGEWERLADDKKGGWSVPLQWMREHNTSGTRREKSRALTEFATMLRDMAPDHAFDPRTMWDPEGDALRQEQMIAEESKSQKGGKKGKNSGKGKKGGKKNQKSNRAEEIIAKNNAKMEREVVEKDLIQLNSRKKMKGAAGREAIAALTLKTTEGQLAQMQALLDSAMNEMKPPPADQPTRLRVAVDILDTLWETETFLDKMLKKDVAAVEKFMKSNKKLLEKARELRDPIKKLYDYCKLGDEVLIYKKLDLISFQLVHMYDRLPPLSMVHSGKWTLDPWQKRVLTYIDEGRSVVVSAPTSSGKTVLSTYLATKTDVNRSKWSKTSSGKWRSEPTTDKKDKRKLSNIQNGILFVTPTEPLAVQVAAMFSKLKSPTTHLPVFKGVGLAVPSRIFPADRFSEKEVDIVVGTATALETILTSKRTLGFNFNYAVFDEVHNLNGEEGDALERIIRLIDCPFLALSATIKNSDQLQNWFQKAIPTRPVELEVVSSRFINLQRHVWNGQELEMLHPCAALTREQILNEGFDAGDLAFTARDVFSLYKAMKKYYGDKVKHIKPSKCKKSNGEYVFPSSVTVRCRMSHVKQYEEILKKEMVKLAKDMPNETDQLLNGFLKVVTKMDLDHQDTSETKGAGETKDDSVSHLPCHEICVDIKKKDMIPAVIFQMDANKCRKMFVSVVERFEREEDEEFPQLAKTRKKMWEEFQSKYKLWLAEAEQCAKNKEQPPPEPSPPAFDVGDPEPSHTMFQKGRHMNGRELKEILKKMDDLAKKTKGRLRIDASHILIRGLRRGVGIYNEELPGPYLQVVQKFAQKGRLGAVFSDESLAYGVNMPFRTSAFVGDPGPEILDALVAQQAAGRAGRRGMDRQGHLVWVGMTWPRIQGLMRGLLPNICGKNPRYPAIALQAEVSSYSSAPVSDIQLKGVCLHTLHDYVHGRKLFLYIILYNISVNYFFINNFLFDNFFFVSFYR